MGNQVLIVEDEEDLREVITDVLTDEGYSVEGAADGGRALELLAQTSPCVVLLDLFLPNVSGFDVLYAMKNDARMARVPVVVMTAAPHLAPAGVPVLPKPFLLTDIVYVVKTFCET